jgi:ArsR family metal-binding transcriptional regulator
MRGGETMTYASGRVGCDPRAVKRHLGRYIYKRKHRWRARKNDQIERGMTIYERGKVRAVTINDSDMAHLIGEYFNSIKKVLESGDHTPLETYRTAVVIDAHGKKHHLETSVEQIMEIELSRENVEFVDVYVY